MLILETLARELVAKLETWPGVHPDHYAHLKSWIEATDKERADFPNIVEQARAIHASDDVEVDDDPFISVGDGGKWVSAWVWVPNADAEDDE